jgi:acetylornithine deacetylase
LPGWNTKGFAWVDIEVFGKAAHGSRPADGDRCDLPLGRVLSRLEQLDPRLQSKPPHPHAEYRIATRVRSSEDGHELSSYPDHARLQMERRTLPRRVGNGVADEVQAFLMALIEQDPTFARTSASDVQPAGVRARRRITTATTAYGRGPWQVLDPPVVGASFWTDAAVLGHSGTPSVSIWPWRRGPALDRGVRERA